MTLQGFCSDTMELKTGTVGYPAAHTEVRRVAAWSVHCSLLTCGR